MPTRPTINTPGWVATTNGATEPTTAQKNAGYAAGETPTAQNWNWLLKSLSQWWAYATAALTGTYVELDADTTMYRCMAGGALPWVLIGNALVDGDKLYDSGSGSCAAILDLGTYLSALDGSTSTYRELRTIRWYYSLTSSSVDVALQSRDINDSGGWTTESSVTISVTGSDQVNSSLAPNIDLAFAPNTGTSGRSTKVYRLVAQWTGGGSFQLYGLLLSYRANAIIIG